MWIKKTIDQEHKSAGEINIIFSSDVHIKGINFQYLQHDYPTDVLAFDYCHGKTVEGDIYIGAETVVKNSIALNISAIDEFSRVIIHGILHLIGYNDHTEDEKCIMRSKEDYYLSLRA